ncbi:MAG: hypothetical protein JWO57_1315 [Pseudonocardiales bacterium]|nr:hypothetical protein [Pseudonocardiales bacterium]
MAIVWANETLLDRLIVANDGGHVGMVDDLELSDPTSRKGPRVTALLSGPTALGPRLGGRPGTWWLAIGRRLRPEDDPYPNRIPVEDITSIDHRSVTLAVDAESVATRRLRGWARDKVIGRLPGSGL